MLVDVGCMLVGMLDAGQVFMSPTTLLMDADVFNFLEPQSLFLDRHRQPPGSLVVLQAVAGDPGRAPGKLNPVKNDQDIGKMGFIKITRIRRKIWSACGDYHQLDGN